MAGKLRLLEEDVRERDVEFDREEEREQNDIKVQLRGTTFFSLTGGGSGVGLHIQDTLWHIQAGPCPAHAQTSVRSRTE